MTPDKKSKSRDLLITILSILLLLILLFTFVSYVLLGRKDLSLTNVKRVEGVVNDDLDRVKEVTGWVDIENKQLDLPETLVDDSKDIGIGDMDKKVLSLAADKDKNFMYSPYSLKSALQQVAFGATGDTYNELINFTGKGDLTLGEDVESVDILNQICLNRNSHATIKTEYKELLEQLGAKEYEVSTGQGARVASDMNKEIEEVTDGQIRNVINPDTLNDKDLVMLLTNTLHFKGSWNKPLETQDIEFTSVGNKKADTVPGVVFHGGSNDSVKYYETPTAKVFSAPYSEDDGRFVFYGFLPNKKGDFDFSDLDLTNLKEPEENYEVTVYAPKFEFKTSFSAIDTLKELGINAAFDSDLADFSEGFNLNGYNVYVSLVQQDTAVKFDENGTEASATTQIGMIETTALRISEVKQYVLELDRPFLFMIWDTQTQQALFTGQIMNPTVTE